MKYLLMQGQMQYSELLRPRQSIIVGWAMVFLEVPRTHLWCLFGLIGNLHIALLPLMTYPDEQHYAQHDRDNRATCSTTKNIGEPLHLIEVIMKEATREIA